MVDKDGNKVDIMKDLIRLENDMENYLKDIDDLLDELQRLDIDREQLFDDFNKSIPSIIVEERQRRKEQLKSLNPPEIKLKRPPMLLKKKTADKKELKTQDEIDEELQDPHQMLQTNCMFRNPIKDILSDLKSFNQKRKDLEDNYAQMRREVFKIK